MLLVMDDIKKIHVRIILVDDISCSQISFIMLFILRKI